MKKTFLLISLLFQNLFLSAQQKINTAGIDSLLTYLYEQGRFMGAVSIMQDGKIVFDKAYGIMGEEGGKPIAAHTGTRYRIGSISKTFTAVMILQLAEEKKLSLDNKLDQYFKEIPNASTITLRQMLTHQSGLFNYTDDPEWSRISQYVSHEDWIKKLAGQKPDFEPGSRTEYSNTNYLLLGYIIEKITGNTYNDNLQKRICKKAGLKNTYLPATFADAKKNEAVSFVMQNNKWEKVDEEHVSAADGAGGIITTATELNRFFDALFHYQLIKEVTLKEMLPGKDDNHISSLNGYGLGIMRIPFDTFTAYGHGGRIDNFSTSSGYFPDQKIAFSLFDNGTVMPENDITIGVLSILFNKPYTFPDFTVASVATQDLKGLLGTYSASSFPLKIIVTEKSGQLFAQASGQDAFPLTPLSRDKYEFKDAGIMISFVRGENDQASVMQMEQSGGHYIFKREDPNAPKEQVIQPDEILLEKYEGTYSSAGFPLKIMIKKAGKTLTAQATGQGAFPLEAVSNTTFKFDDANIRITFKTDADGTVTGLTMTQGKSYEFEKE